MINVVNSLVEAWRLRAEDALAQMKVASEAPGLFSDQRVADLTFAFRTAVHYHDYFIQQRVWS